MSGTPVATRIEDLLFAGPGEMAARMRAKDWASTSLGPPEGWPRSLQTAVRILLTSRYAMWLGWGPELRFFYNDAYGPTLGIKQAWALGATAPQVWAEIWPAIGPRIDLVLQRGEATWDEGLLLFLERSGYSEETYHTFSYSPLPDDAGAIGGMLCVVTEETDRVIGARRLALLRELAAQLAATSSTEDVFAAVERCVESDARDLPFSLVYLFEGDGERARLVARSGIAADHPRAPATLAAGEVWPLAELLADPSARVIALAAGPAWPAGPWAQAPAQAFVVPLAQQGQAGPAGAFIAGVNPHRALDEGYQDFVRLFVGQIAASLANVRAYEAERRRAAALAELDRAKTAFFSNVSHEFRTPLTLMLGPLAEVLGDPTVTPAAREQLQLVHRNGQRLLRLVNTLLDFSRIEAGRAQARYEPVDLAELTVDLASAFQSATDEAGLRLVIDCPPLGEPVHVDREMWEKIVLNLISNAFKFTMAGEIRVALRRHGDRVALTVADTGLGIPAHELPRLFERFHRVAGARGRTHEGTGIGLALVQELARLHGGDVAVESEVDRGTTFTVTLPLGAAHLPAERVSETARAGTFGRAAAHVEEARRWLPAAAEEAPPAVAPATAGYILLADDNADMRNYIRRLLGGRWELEAVGNGAEAREAVKRRRPDLVITDVMMPVLDGFGLLQALRADEHTRRLPVLMLSARAGEEARLGGLQAGASDYLVKPFSARELTARVDALVLRGKIEAVEEAQARRLERMFAQAPVGVAILRGPTHVFELANPPYLELVGDRPVVGKPIREALPEVVDQGIVELLDRVAATREPYVGRSQRVLIARRPGQPPDECFFDFVYQPLLRDDGEVEGIAVVVFEVTALAKARREADGANRAKDEFLAMLGHELRNPLAPILTALQLMRLRGTPGVDRERAILERQVRHLVSLVDDLLDVSRITQGKVELKIERVELSSVVARAIEMASPLLEQHRHDLRVEVPRVGLAVDGDPGRLAQVVANLLTNAAKYTRPGGTITVTGHAGGARLELRVRDTGIGIDPEVLPRVFEPFTQERQAIDRSQGGLGLGLAIVRSLVEMHGGQVRAASPGRGLGSEFTVALPTAGHGAPAERRQRDITPVPGDPDHACRVLVVDDNEDAADMLVAALGLSRHVVRSAHDGPSALRLAADFEPDVAILDIGLPVMDGFELAQRFADHPRLRRTRLIAVTGYGQEQDRARTAAAGFCAHLVKPVDLDALQATIEALRSA